MKPGERPLSVLVIGAGMYVCGRGIPGIGTILPVLIEDQAKGEIGEVWVVSTSGQSSCAVREKIRVIEKRLAIRSRINLLPEDCSTDSSAYLRGLKELPSPGCVIISTPDHLHFSMARDALKAGFDTLVVKPLTPKAAEARELIRLCAQQRLYGAVEFHKRFDEVNLLMRQAFHEGRLGELLYSTVEFSQRRHIQDIFKAWQNRTNVFQYLGVHYADLIFFIIGGLPLRVMARGQAASGQSYGHWDAIQAVIDWRLPVSGRIMTSTIATNWIDPNTTAAMSDQKMLLVGTKGRYQADQKNRGVELVTEQGIEALNPYFSQTYAGADEKLGIRGYGPASIRQFLTDVRFLCQDRSNLEKLNQIRPSFNQALVSTVIIEAVNQSLGQDGSWVECKGGLDPFF